MKGRDMHVPLADDMIKNSERPNMTWLEMNRKDSPKIVLGEEIDENMINLWMNIYMKDLIYFSDFTWPTDLEWSEVWLSMSWADQDLVRWNIVNMDKSTILQISS